MSEASRSRRVETREFWEEAIRLWAESGLSVREFCSREGLTEYTFYSWRRELMPAGPPAEVIQEPSATEGDLRADGRRRCRRRQAADSAVASTSTVEFLPVHVVGEAVPRAHAASSETATGAATIEIVGASPWRVRIAAGFDPATLKAVLTVLEGQPC
jgi:transposase-like protein